MGYKVHRLDINMETDATKLEVFLNELGGEVVSIIPNVRKTTPRWVGLPSLDDEEEIDLARHSIDLSKRVSDQSGLCNAMNNRNVHPNHR